MKQKLYGLFLIACLSFYGCGGSNGSNVTNDPAPENPPPVNEEDIIYPTITSANVYDGATKIPVNIAFKVQFSEEMDSTTINSDTFLLCLSGFACASQSIIPGTVTYEDRVATFTPDENLSFATHYTVALSPFISDLAGNILNPWGTGAITIDITTDIAPPSLFEFTLTPRKTTTSTVQDGSLEIYLDLDLVSGSALPTSLTTNGCPENSVCTITPNQVFESYDDKVGLVKLFIETTQQTQIGEYLVEVVATGGDVNHSASVSIIINNTLTNGNPSKYWGEEGLSVSIEDGHQMRSIALNDGSSNTIIVWEDDRNAHGKTDIYGQKIDMHGGSYWQDNGLPLVDFINPDGRLITKNQISAVPDGTGGFFLCWVDNRKIWYRDDIYIQRFDGDGNKLWQSGDTPVSVIRPDNNDKSNPKMVPDGNGGVIITWWEMRDGFNFSVWAQRISANGTPSWSTNGVPIAFGGFSATHPKIVSDGKGGAIIVWQDSGQLQNRGNIMAQNIDENGDPLWAINGIKVADKVAQTGTGGFAISSDLSGGVIVSWVDGRTLDSNESDIYAQKINANGNTVWDIDGVPICMNPGHEYYPEMISTIEGGAIIVWDDHAGVDGNNVMAQKINADGGVLWQANGVLVNYGGSGHYPQIVGDDLGGGIITWSDTSWDPFGPNVMSQHLDDQGQPLWGANGFEAHFVLGAHYGYLPKLLKDDFGGVILYWWEERYNNDWDIYVQRISDSQ